METLPINIINCHALFPKERNVYNTKDGFQPMLVFCLAWKVF